MAAPEKTGRKKKKKSDFPLGGLVRCLHRPEKGKKEKKKRIFNTSQKFYMDAKCDKRGRKKKKRYFRPILRRRGKRGGIKKGSAYGTISFSNRHLPLIVNEQERGRGRGKGTTSPSLLSPTSI